MINLLPHDTRERLRADYRMRFAAVSLLAGAAVLVIAGGLLAPAYFRAGVAQNSLLLQASVTDLSISQPNLVAASKNGSSALAIYKALHDSAAIPRPSTVIDSLLGVRDTTIKIQRIDLTATASSATVDLSGVADTRDDMLAFKQRLMQVPNVSGVVLPPEALAVADQTPFVITVTYTLPQS